MRFLLILLLWISYAVSLTAQFSEPQTIYDPPFTSPLIFDIADLDMDGYEDIIFANAYFSSSNDGLLYIAWGSETGYEYEAAFDPSYRFFSQTAVDLDNDGILDLIGRIRNYEDALLVKRGLGNRNFETCIIDLSAKFVFAQDIDEDGQVEIIFEKTDGQNRIVMSRLGTDFELDTVQLITENWSQFQSGIQMIDLQGDGDLDLVSSSAWILMEDSQFLAAEQHPESVSHDVYDDIDGDGFIDLAGMIDGKLFWFPWDEQTAQFGSKRPLVPLYNVEDFTLGDINGDGLHDLVYTDENYELNYCLKAGPAAFSIPTNCAPLRFVNLQARDQDRNGISEIVIASRSGHFAGVLRSDESKGCSIDYILGRYPGDVRDAIPIQLDPDGYQELLFSSRFTNDLYLMHNDSGNFQEWEVALSDLRGATHFASPHDLADKAIYLLGESSIYRSSYDCYMSFEPPELIYRSPLQNNAELCCPTFADVNQDGIKDLIFRATYSPGLLYLEGRGNGKWEKFPTHIESASNAFFGRYYDFDTQVGSFSDVAAVDLFISDHEGQLFYFKDKGTLGFEEETQVHTPENALVNSFHLADIDNDGQDELLAMLEFEELESQYRIGLLRHGNSQEWEELTAHSQGARLAAVFDVDGDGKLDIILKRWETQGNFLTWYRQESELEFVEAQSIPVGGEFTGSLLQAMDYDNDGDLDILATHPNTGRMQLVTNSTLESTEDSTSENASLDCQYLSAWQQINIEGSTAAEVRFSLFDQLGRLVIDQTSAVDETICLRQFSLNSGLHFYRIETFDQHCSGSIYIGSN